MLANPHKFQAIFLASADMEFKFEIDDITLVAEADVKLPGINLDRNVDYDIHIKQICKNAGNHLNALKRLSPYISVNHRMTIFRCLIFYHFQLCNTVTFLWSGEHRKDGNNSGERAAFCLRGLRFRLGFSYL